MSKPEHIKHILPIVMENIKRRMEKFLAKQKDSEVQHARLDKPTSQISR